MKNLSNSNRILVWIAIAIVVALIVAAIAGGNVRTFDADTPEGVVQRYLDATIDGDEAQADGYLTAALATRCDDAFEIGFRGRDNDTYRIALTDVSINADHATVEVSVTEGDAGAFDSYSYTHDERYELTRVAGVWKIDDQTWPWHGC